MTHSRRGVTLGLLLIGAAGCSDDGDDTMGPTMELVRVSGICRNADDGSNAAGVRVSLLGTSYADEVPTGDDGAFALLVPKGSQLLLHTDDFDAARGDAWFPLINVDPETADDDISNWNIHACPNSTCPELGSVAAWDNFLQNGDTDDLFAVKSSADASGIVSALLYNFADGMQVPGVSGLTATMTSPDFVPGYLAAGRFWGSKNIPDCAVGPDIMVPGGTETTDDGTWFSFGDPGYSGTEITLILTDNERDVEWEAIDIPIRPGTISLILRGLVDGVPNQSFAEMCPYFPVTCPTFGRTAD